MAFYKNDGGQMLIAPNFVINRDYELRAENLDSLTLPIDGWNWFETDEEAYQTYGIEMPKEDN